MVKDETLIVQNKPRTTKRTHVTARQARAVAPKLPLWSRPGYLIRRLHQLHDALWAEECRQANLTPVQYGLLSALAVRGELDQTSLAEALGLDRTNVAEVLTRLARRQLIRRKPDPADARARLASLTPRGRTLTARVFADMQRAQDRLLAPLKQTERDQFMHTLRQLIEANNDHGRAPLHPKKIQTG